MKEPAIEISGLQKSFGKTQVLNDVDLSVPAGSTFALLGRNGVGKTTTIKILLGLAEPDQGSCRVLGLDPRNQSVEIRQRIGYMAEGQTMHGWMKIKEIIWFCSRFYPSWNPDEAERLRDAFDLDPNQKVKNLSKGQNSRLALLLALAHTPELVILDDPTLGLDPIARKDFLREVIVRLQSRNATIFFSTHLLYEIEPVADYVAIMEGGKIIRRARTDELRDQVKRVMIEPKTRGALGDAPGVLDVQNVGRRLGVVVEDIQAALDPLAGLSASVPEVLDMNLDEIFEAYVAGRPEPPKDQPSPDIAKVA
jgi:ABC-2 type transport system ATP-binding protein